MKRSVLWPVTPYGLGNTRHSVRSKLLGLLFYLEEGADVFLGNMCNSPAQMGSTAQNFRRLMTLLDKKKKKTKKKKNKHRGP
jgi:hypothetical protein